MVLIGSLPIFENGVVRAGVKEAGVKKRPAEKGPIRYVEKIKSKIVVRTRASLIRFERMRNKEFILCGLNIKNI